MKKEDIKTLEDAMKYIDIVEKDFQTKETDLQALNSKLEEHTKKVQTLENENGELKKSYYDLWLSKPTIKQGQQEQGQKEETVKTLEELLMEE